MNQMPANKNITRAQPNTIISATQLIRDALYPTARKSFDLAVGESAITTRPSPESTGWHQHCT